MTSWRVHVRGLASLLCLLACLAASRAQAQTSSEVARASFERGVAHAANGDWEQAAQAFEASLVLDDRAATRANLVHAYSELLQPLDVVRHAVAFLALPQAPHRAEARAAIERDLSRAEAQLGILTHDAMPTDSELRVDGAPAPVADGAGRIYLLPGLHRLELRVGEGEPEVIEMRFLAGQVVAWPRQSHAPDTLASASADGPATTTTLPRPDVEDVGAASAPTATRQGNSGPRRRRRAARTLAGLGVSTSLAAVGTYLGALHRAESVRRHDPYATGFIRSSDDYQRLASTVAPLALVGGLLCAQAVALGPRSSHGGTSIWAYGALGAGLSMLGAAFVLALHDADRIGKSSLDEPDRQAAALAAGVALPVLTYGVTSLITRSGDDDSRAQIWDGKVRW